MDSEGTPSPRAARPDRRITTFSGKRVDPFDFKPEDVCIEDIAHALSCTGRFSGHSPFYSVAQHSVLVAQRCPPSLRLAGLLHDASEAYLPDLPPQHKQSYWIDTTDGESMDRFTDVEQEILLYVYKAFEVPTRTFGDLINIKSIDRRMLATEWRSLMPTPWEGEAEPYDFHIVPMLPREAEAYFLGVYEEIVDEDGD